MAFDDPRFATGDTYSGTTDNGLANKAAPSTGRRANGFDRDKRVAARVLNHVLHTHGEHLAALVDEHIWNWTPQPGYATADLANNRNISTSPPLLYPAGERWLIKTPDGGTGVAFHARKHGQGVGMGSSDTSAFTASADSSAGADAIILTDRTLNRVVEISSGYTARKSDDWGATWSAGGTAFTGTGGVTCGGYFGAAWHAIKTDLDGTHDVGSSSTLSGSWTNTDVGDPDPPSFMRFVASPDIALFLPSASTSLMQVVANDGGGWSLETISGITSATSTWRGDYNANLGLWLFTNLAGECYISADGLTWALYYTHSTAIYDVAASGRGWILSCVTEDFTGAATFPHLAFLPYGLDPVTAYRMRWESPTQYYSRFHLTRFRGLVLAARVNEPATQILEWWESGVYPLDVDANGF